MPVCWTPATEGASPLYGTHGNLHSVLVEAVGAYQLAALGVNSAPWILMLVARVSGGRPYPLLSARDMFRTPLLMLSMFCSRPVGPGAAGGPLGTAAAA